MTVWTRCTIAMALASACAAQEPPLEVRGITMVSLGRHGFDADGHKTPRAPTRVIPYVGTFKLTMDVAGIKPVAVAHNDHCSYRVSKLSNVAGPVIV